MGWTAASAAGEGESSPPSRLCAPRLRTLGPGRSEEVGLEAAVATYSAPAREDTCELGMAKVSSGKQRGPGLV